MSFWLSSCIHRWTEENTLHESHTFTIMHPPHYIYRRTSFWEGVPTNIKGGRPLPVTTWYIQHGTFPWCSVLPCYELLYYVMIRSHHICMIIHCRYPCQYLDILGCFPRPSKQSATGQDDRPFLGWGFPVNRFVSHCYLGEASQSININKNHVYIYLAFLLQILQSTFPPSVPGGSVLL